MDVLLDEDVSPNRLEGGRKTHEDSPIVSPNLKENVGSNSSLLLSPQGKHDDILAIMDTLETREKVFSPMAPQINNTLVQLKNNEISSFVTQEDGRSECTTRVEVLESSDDHGQQIVDEEKHVWSTSLTQKTACMKRINDEDVVNNTDHSRHALESDTDEHFHTFERGDIGLLFGSDQPELSPIIHRGQAGDMIEGRSKEDDDSQRNDENLATGNEQSCKENKRDSQEAMYGQSRGGKYGDIASKADDMDEACFHTIRTPEKSVMGGAEGKKHSLGCTPRRKSSDIIDCRMLSPLPSERRSDVSESVQRNRDVNIAQETLDATSVILIERLRGAAQRRKLQMTRSRDSLAAKEKRQLIAIAESKQAPQSVLEEVEEEFQSQPISQQINRKRVDPYKPFKAKPLPGTTGLKGTGGLVGVPKVSTKPTTTPFSPQLGSRRRDKEEIKALNTPKMKQNSRSRSDIKNSLLLIRSASKTTKSARRANDSVVCFKARPAPVSTGIQGHGGQAGVPKIAKRPVTIASSPCLGPKRRKCITSEPKKIVRRSAVKRRQVKYSLSSKRLDPPKGMLSGSDASMAKARALREIIQQEEIELNRTRQFCARPLPKSLSDTLSNSSESSTRLLGLDLLHNDASVKTDLENVPPIRCGVSSKTSSQSIEYRPHSTKRAEERVKFDTGMVERREQKSLERMKIRESLIKQRYGELGVIRDKLR